MRSWKQLSEGGGRIADACISAAPFKRICADIITSLVLRASQRRRSLDDEVEVEVEEVLPEVDADVVEVEVEVEVLPEVDDVLEVVVSPGISQTRGFVL